jgi:hypothetical protein
MGNTCTNCSACNGDKGESGEIQTSKVSYFFNLCNIL